MGQALGWANEAQFYFSTMPIPSMAFEIIKRLFAPKAPKQSLASRAAKC